jgi:hypothetical protein
LHQLEQCLGVCAPGRVREGIDECRHTYSGGVSRQNLIRVENGAIPLAPQIEKRAWIRLRVALRGARRFSLGKDLGTSGIPI